MTIVSPHFDDVPLSLGQSLRDGALSRCDVLVRVAFGRTNWTNWVHPTASRATPIGWWRRLEESVAARRFGYRWTAAGWEEALLRWGTLDHERLLDVHADLSADPLVAELASWLRAVAEPVGPDAPELLLVPAELLQTVAQAAFAPLFVVFTSFFYADMRARREGLDLALKMEKPA